MKIKNMHLAGPTAAASMLGLGLLFVTRLTSPTAMLSGSSIAPNLLNRSYELSQISYTFPHQDAKVLGGGRLTFANSRDLAGNDFASHFTPDGFTGEAHTRGAASFDDPNGIAFNTRLSNTNAYTPSFSRSRMSAGFGAGAMMGFAGARAVAASRGSVAPFPASIRASSTVADGATIAASLPDVATAADLTPDGSAAVHANRITEPSASSMDAVSSRVAATSAVDVEPTPYTPDRTPVPNVVQAMASTSWTAEPISGGDVVMANPTTPRASRPTGNPTLVDPAFWVPPVRHTDVLGLVPLVDTEPPTTFPMLVTPEPSSVVLFGAGLAALAMAARRRRDA